MSPDTLRSMVAPAASQLTAQQMFLRAALARHVSARIEEIATEDGISPPAAALALCEQLEPMGLAYVANRGPWLTLAMHGLEVRAQTRARALMAWAAEVQTVTP
ncbi:MULTISPECIES: hypothetical protein [unclassified Marinovum]|uniref:hypothetical protein n=1 Tax=unclassified Marinovum TaxID=2647166 RepID=UPI003EDC24FA